MTIEITADEARAILNAEDVCLGEGQAGVPDRILAAIGDAFPELREEFRWLPAFKAEVQ